MSALQSGNSKISSKVAAPKCDDDSVNCSLSETRVGGMLVSIQDYIRQSETEYSEKMYPQKESAEEWDFEAVEFEYYHDDEFFQHLCYPGRVSEFVPIGSQDTSTSEEEALSSSTGEVSSTDDSEISSTDIADCFSEGVWICGRSETRLSDCSARTGTTCSGCCGQDGALCHVFEAALEENAGIYVRSPLPKKRGARIYRGASFEKKLGH